MHEMRSSMDVGWLYDRVIELIGQILLQFDRWLGDTATFSK